LNNNKVKEISNQVIDIQIDAIKKLKGSIDADFEKIIQHLSKIEGRIIITGIGKSAIIGMKISSTLNSTGSPSIFMHGSDALQIMNDNKITNLIVTKKNKYIGMLHIHDIINAGL
jgi:D-arabinose 5-phosphate isomerase GutQ